MFDDEGFDPTNEEEVLPPIDPHQIAARRRTATKFLNIEVMPQVVAGRRLTNRGILESIFEYRRKNPQDPEVQRLQTDWLASVDMFKEASVTDLEQSGWDAAEEGALVRRVQFQLDELDRGFLDNILASGRSSLGITDHFRLALRDLPLMLKSMFKVGI